MKTLTSKVTAEKTVSAETYLMREMGVSRRLLTKLKRTPMGITRNGVHIRTIDNVYYGDEIAISYEDTSLLEANYSLSVPVAYEDESIVIFDKPVGMPVHPSINHQGDTLGNFFAALYPDCTFRPVNRLDKDTSGLCAVAKSPHSAHIYSGNIQKTYYAVICGKISGSGTIDFPIERAEKSIILRRVSENGQRAVTHYNIVRSNDKYSLAEIFLETGRTHQIRVHFSYIGYPLAGDDMYGGSTEDIDCQALHCGKLEFKSLSDGCVKEVYSDIREDMKGLVY